MRASLVITALGRLIAQHGDLEVTVVHDLGQDSVHEFEVENIAYDPEQRDFLVNVVRIADFADGPSDRVSGPQQQPTEEPAGAHAVETVAEHDARVSAEAERRATVDENTQITDVASAQAYIDDVSARAADLQHEGAVIATRQVL